MKKTAVAYYSKTGSTGKVACAMAQALGCFAYEIKDYPADQNIDLLFIGGAIYGGQIDPALVTFIETLDPKKVGQAAVFATYASVHAQTEGKAEALIQSALEKRGIPSVSETFKCKGRFLFLNGKHPDEASLQNARMFAAALAGI